MLAVAVAPRSWQMLCIPSTIRCNVSFMTPNSANLARPRSSKVVRTATTIGEQLSAWRKLQGLTAQQVADRAGVGRAVVSRIESGDLGVRFGSVLEVARALGILDRLVEATDPYETDLGRARADEILPRRVRT